MKKGNKDNARIESGRHNRSEATCTHKKGVRIR